MKNKRTATALVTMLFFAASLAPFPIVADGGADEQKPIRLYATARFGPIAKVNCSVAAVGGRGAVVIDGRAVAGEQSLWGGELIQVVGGASARVSFDSIGEVSLSSGAAARLSTSISDFDGTGRGVIVAWLMSGDMKLRLGGDAGAYVEAGGSAFTATPGAAFRVAINGEGRAEASATTGEVRREAQTTPQQRFTLRPPAGQSGSLSVAARATRQVQIQVTDENDRPATDIPVVFTLGDPCLGSLGIGAGAGTSFTGRTDNRGIATVPWIAGAARCASTIVATVQGTSASFTYSVQIGAPGFWTTQNKVLVGVGAAAAGAGAGVVITRTRDNREPIRPVPPPVVTP